VELEHHSRPTCASCHNASTVVGVVNKLDRRRVLSILVAKFSVPRVWNKVSEGSTLSFGHIRIFL